MTDKKIEKIQVKDIFKHINQEIDTFLLVTKKELRDGKKDKYLRLEFVDKTGSINGNVWNEPLKLLDGYKEGDVVKIRALVNEYKEQIQLNIKKIRKAEDNEINIDDYTPRTKKNIQILSDELFEFINSISCDKLKTLLKNIFEDKELYNVFTNSPAAKSWHHNFVGGLLEHTISVTKICNFACSLYQVNRDILITGALLHDFGKIYEYNILPYIEFTDEGRLLGHIVAVDELIVKTANKIDLFPKEKLMLIRHLMLSHHGEMEKGAVKLPQTIEAIVLHFADNLDAQTTGVYQLIQATADRTAKWTEFDKLNNRYFYIGSQDSK
jgi:3'-5' exoribonuclease